MTSTIQESCAAAIKVEPIGGRIGAEIRGVQLGAELGDATRGAIRAALLRYKVIFFRGQHHLDDDGQEGFAAAMGVPIKHPNAAAAQGSRHLLDLGASEGYAASIWHTDMTFLPAYPEASILRAIVIPDHGGDTMWANCATAYEDLPVPLKLMADALTAFHDNQTDYDSAFEDSVRERLGAFADRPPHFRFVTEHPVVRVHPETGERVLLIGTFAKRLRGFDGAQSQRILSVLQDYVVKPENCVRWRWTPGDVAMWDNRATQHRSVSDFGDQARQLRRATIHGTIPVGVDGRESRQVEGSLPRQSS